MSSLYDLKNTSDFIINNQFLDWNDIIPLIYNPNDIKYKFCMNSELVDVKDRFRIVKVGNKTLVVKKTSIKKAELEFMNFCKINKLLENKIIDGYIIKPIVLNNIIINGDAYLISEYTGHTLQEALYDDKKSNILSFGVFSNIIKYFFENKIMYRGFIPRNIIVKENAIFLMDFEDLLIENSNSNVKLDLLYITNFILNWQYFFEISDLINLISDLNIVIEDRKKLMEFEKKYKMILGYDVDNQTLRNCILQTVVNSEKPSVYMNKLDYEIMPNDLAHLISDLFGDSIDALFDLLCENVRKRDEYTYYKYLRLFSKIIYLEKYNIPKLQYYCFLIITMLMETVLYNTDVFEINQRNFYYEFEHNIKSSNFEIAKSFLNHRYLEYKIKMEKMIKDVLKVLSSDRCEKYGFITDDIIQVSDKMIKVKRR